MAVRGHRHHQLNATQPLALLNTAYPLLIMPLRSGRPDSPL